MNMSTLRLRKPPRGRGPRQDEAAITDVLAALPEEPSTATLTRAAAPDPVWRGSYAPAGEHPYEHGPSVTAGLRMLGAGVAPDAPLPAPGFTPRPGHARATAPQLAARVPVRAPARPAPRHAQQQAGMLRRVRNSLARGITPVFGAVTAEHVPAGRLPQVSDRRVTAAAHRLDGLAYPEPGTGGDYAAVIAAVDRITGTTGPSPVITPRSGEEG